MKKSSLKDIHEADTSELLDNHEEMLPRYL